MSRGKSLVWIDTLETAMREKMIGPVEATEALVTYIEENQVFDKLADCGCDLPPVVVPSFKLGWGSIGLAPLFGPF
jgi:hypothetical protein